jgi:hypothetical protein
MTDEKLNIEFLPIKNKNFLFGDQLITIRPYLTLNDRAAICLEYMQNINGEPIMLSEQLAKRYLVAESALVLQIVDIVTNIEIEKLDSDLLIASGLWDDIKDKITNYWELQHDIDKILELQQAQDAIEKSVGQVIDNIATRLIQAIDKLSELDAESLKQSAEQFTKSLDELNTKIPGIAGTPAPRKQSKKIVQ